MPRERISFAAQRLMGPEVAGLIGAAPKREEPGALWLRAPGIVTGIGGTLSLGVQHVPTATALSISRIADWFTDETVVSTRRSPFARRISHVA